MSERNLSAATKQATTEDVIAPIFMMSAVFPEGEVFLWTGTGSIDWNGEAWDGIGDFLTIDIATETMDGSSQGSSVVVGGIDSDLFNSITLGDYQGGRAKLWLGMLDIDDGSVKDTPYLLFSGLLDSDEMEDDGSSVNLKINVEHRMADLLRAREYRYTDQDQQALHPGENDKGLEFMGSMVDVQLKWGKV